MAVFSLPLKPQAAFLQTPRGLLLRLSAGHFLVDGYAGFIYPILPLLAERDGFGLPTAGLLLMLSSISSSVLQPLYGLFSDRWPRLNWMLIGVVMAAGWISLLGFAQGVYALAVVMFFAYMGVGLFHPSATRTAHALFERRHNLVMSLFLSAGTVGFALGPLTASWLVKNSGLSATLWLGLPALLVLPGLMQLKLQPGQAQPVQDFSSDSEESLAKAAGLHGVQKGAETRWLALMLAHSISRAIVLVAMPAFLPFLWRQQGYDITTVGLVIGLSAGVSGVFGMLSGWLADRWGERRVILCSLVPALGLLPLMLCTTGAVTFTVFGLMYGLVASSVGVTMASTLSGIRSKAGWVASLIGGFSFGVAGLLMPAFGSLADRIGIQNAFLGLLLPLGLSILLPLLAKKPTANAAACPV
ncbi:MAG: MFS transporter [Candidatus Melainabacteria bacterium]|nr:MFS transporter [Candidatus Melainabacteria bacterium]